MIGGSQWYSGNARVVIGLVDVAVVVGGRRIAESGSGAGCWYACGSGSYFGACLLKEQSPFRILFRNRLYEDSCRGFVEEGIGGREEGGRRCT